VVVFLVLALIWAVVLVPPVVRVHQARKQAFLGSFAWLPDDAPPPPPPRSSSVQRRRRIAGGLLLAMAATLLVGLLPTFRVLLVVHLFLVDSFLGYIALLAHQANRAAKGAVGVVGASGDGRRRAVPRSALVPRLGPMTPTA
jgi:hypothetical protein